MKTKKNWFIITLALIAIALLLKYIFKNKDEEDTEN